MPKNRSRHRGGHRHHGNAPRPENQSQQAPIARSYDLRDVIAIGQTREIALMDRLQKEGVQRHESPGLTDQWDDEVIPFYGILVERHVAMKAALQMNSTDMMQHAIRQVCHYLDRDPVSLEECVKHLHVHLPNEVVRFPSPDAEEHSAEQAQYNHMEEIRRGS
jgi:hypothetical protein